MSKNKYAYFIGCTTPSRVPNYDLSTRRIMDRLGIKLIDMPNAGCCGLYYELIDELTHLSMAARIISIAEDLKIDLMVICNGCNGSLIRANKKLRQNPEIKDKVNEILADIDREFRGIIDVKHYVRVLWEDIGIDRIKRNVVKKLNIKVGAHYGCHLLKPSDDIKFDNPKEPQSLDQLIEITGAKSIDYYDKQLCCGGYVLTADKRVAYTMAGEKLRNVRSAGADIMVTVCPFCNVIYDANQRAIETEIKESFNIPVLHYPQLLGLAMGYSFRDLGLEQNRIRINPKLFE